MSYVITQFAGWIFLGALGLGLLIGFFTWAHKQRGSWLSGWLNWAAIAFVVGLFAAIFKLIAGRGGLWLETALLIFAAYIVGCVLGSWLRALFAAPEPVLARTGAAAAIPAAAVASAAFPAAPEGAPLAIDSGIAYPGKRPPGLAKPEGAPDDLTNIAGIVGTDQKMLNDLGIHHARQVAGWSPDNARWINHHMALPGRVEAEGWIPKAAAFVSAGGAAAAAGGSVAKAAAAKAAAPAATAVSSGATASAAAAGTVAAATAATRANPAGAGVDGGVSAASGSLSPGTAAAGTPGDIYANHPGTRPAALAQARNGKGDELKRIGGISPGNEASLNRLGLYHYDQIGQLKADESQWVNSFMGSPGRIERDNWVSQARILDQAQRNEVQQATSAEAAKAQAAAAEAAKAQAAAAEASRVQAAAAEAAKAQAAAAEAAKAQAAAAEASRVQAAAALTAVAGSAPLAAAAIAPAAGDINAAHPGARPQGLAQARSGKVDDLKRISGVGPQNEQKLHGLGIYHFDQIAAWSAPEAQWVGSFMAFPGRIEREDWIGQCKLLASGQETEHSRRLLAEAGTPAPGDVNAAHPGSRPTGLAQARGGKADDLKKISGVGPLNEQKLNDLGIYHFDQIAGWSQPEAQWAGSFLAFPGRIEREDWIGQCKLLASGQETEHSRRLVAEAARASGITGAAASGVAAAVATAAVATAASVSTAVSAGGETAAVTAAVLSAAELSALEGKYAGKRPVGMAAPRGGEPDDLLKIRGVGKSNLQQLHALGIFHFDQISKWSKDELRWVGSYMAFPGRLEKEDWIGQAKHYAQRRAIELANRAASAKKS